MTVHQNLNDDGRCTRAPPSALQWLTGLLAGVAISGALDDLIVGKDRVLFGIIEVGGFLGLGSHLIAVPYSSLQISDGGRRIVLPGATKEQVKGLPEFKYR